MQRLLPLLFVFLAVAAGALQPAAPQGFGRHVVTVEAEETLSKATGKAELTGGSVQIRGTPIDLN